eukprot:gene11589-21826_t
MEEKRNQDNRNGNVHKLQNTVRSCTDAMVARMIPKSRKRRKEVDDVSEGSSHGHQTRSNGETVFISIPLDDDGQESTTSV